MATNEIKLGINLRQNKNSKNAGYGKYYPEVDTRTTLTLRGFAKHMSDHGSIYSLDLIEGVLKKITQCLPELISQGVPVCLDPLGTFLPTCDVDKPLLNIPAMEGADPNEVVKGVHIRFLPYGVEDDNITSRRFKEEYCSLEFRNIIDTQEVTIDGKKKKITTLKPVATAIAEYKAAHGESGSAGNGSTDSGNSGSSQNSGSQNSGSQQSGSEAVTAPEISGTTPFTDTTQVTIQGPQGAALYYTTDGSTPTSESMDYSEPITLSATTTVKAIAILNGESSEVASKTFTKSGESGGFDLGN
ncbi:MAG: chitobiase/beta-hexosaminidase C-terminal domain-containing protein [Prevotella sp.]|nr:chitobiase/beta-hexosaminidase C-terminal domain-containing protein [Prevotella sp.]